MALQLFQNIRFNDTIAKREVHTYQPYVASKFNYSDEVRITIQCQDLITATYDSYIYIEGKMTPTDPAKDCKLIHNGIAFLFDEIRYELGGRLVDVCKSPGITTSMKGLVSYDESDSKALSTAGWKPLEPDNNPEILHAHKFFAYIPLKFLFGFAEDYKKVIINMRQDLVMIRARSDINCYKGETTATFDIEKIEWKVPHVILSDASKLEMLRKLNIEKSIPFAFRKWDLYELPALRKTKTDIWPVKTSTHMEKPRYMLIAFKTKQGDQHNVRANHFDHVNVSNIKLYLNSEIYPYEDWKLDFGAKNYLRAYLNYMNFQDSYYEREPKPLLNYTNFLKSPIFVIDCSKQNEALKSSTVDVKLELEATEDFKEHTAVYALILHDVVFEYLPLTGEVRKM